MQSLYERLMSRMSEALKPARALLNPQLATQKRQQLGFAPFITISRDPGSGGRPIAKRIAKLTGFQYYNKELIEKVSQTTHLREKLLTSIDEKGRSSIQDWVHSLFNPDYVSDVKYIKYLCNVILTLAEKGNCIILGRGGNFITSGERGLHVRVSAPYPVRVQRAIKFEKISRTKAQQKIRKTDSDRKNFISQYFNKNISNANYYDLILNTTYTSIEDATKIILKAFELKFPGYLRRYKLLRKI